MKKIIAILIIAISFNAFGQSDAKTLLNQVSKKIKSYDNISLDFKYSLENPSENIKQETKGDVILQGEKYRLNILGVTQLFDGEKLYSISTEDEEVTISSHIDQDKDVITPSKMLSFYESGYTYKMDIKQDIKGRKIQYVKLTPIDSNSEIKNILLGIDAQTKHIYNLIQIGNNGTQTKLTVNSFQTNEQLPNHVFTFDATKYKDYYINNLD
ncbi:LolA family protein [Pseudotamlana agarivorans]|uniref:LolA family protein n=1 Tax=Pseudotamlana agarivorans TaxID=481183 RepID=UPI00082B20EF|nr:outer membrane lipoprotein carrier protein LolA [Tamlana agarivorans]